MNAVHRPGWLAALAVFLCLLAATALAEHLPIHIFTSADGLGSSFIDYLMRDSKGFLWICSRDGLSRFDGSQFVTYQIGETGEVAGVESIYEQKNGTYWVGTTNGFYRFTTETLTQATPVTNGRPRLYAEYIGPERGHMYEDHAGKLWLITNGLFDVIEQDGKVQFPPVDLHLPDNLSKGLNFVDSPEDNDGSFWLPAPRGVIRRLPDGRVIYFQTDRENLQNVVIRDSEDRIWVGRGKEFFVIRPEPVESLSNLGAFTLRKLEPSAEFSLKVGDSMKFPEKPGEIYRYTSSEFLQKHIVRRIFESSDGHIWIPTEQNLVEYDGATLHLYTPKEGLVPALARMVEDAAGNLWFGGYSGLVRLDRKGLKSYDTADGLSSTNIYSVFSDANGSIYVATGELSISQWDGNRFHTVHPKLPPDSGPIWTSPFAFRDREGDWWLLTQKGLSHFTNVRTIDDMDGKEPAEVFDKTSGLPNSEAFHIFEDKSGDIWFSQLPPRSTERRVVRWSRASGELHTFSPEEGFPEGKSAMSFAEDRFGNLWMGFYEGGIGRYRDGKLTMFEQEAGMPRNVVTDIYIDRFNRMWMASAIGGLSLIEDTSVDQPQVRRLSTDDGLSTNNIRTINEDDLGRIYLGTVRGVDRLSPDTMRIKHYTVNDGLPADFVVDSFRDNTGRLWFATTNGLSVLSPPAQETESAPNILIGNLSIAGEQQSLPQLGSELVDKGELASSQNNLQIDFFGLDFRAGESLRYQYKFDGVDADWSPPSTQRNVTFAKLSPGSYRFLVRAIDSEGQVSAVPASVNFKILPPIWQRWWFVTAMVLATAFVVVAFYRYRTARLREVNAALAEAKLAEENLRLAREEKISELEKVRSRIATDLHDDIGASLTQIAVLSEVARAQAGKGNGGPPESLSKISQVSNELIGTMSDIVWAINPAKDRFADLIQRMRRIASDLLSPKGIAVHFQSREQDKKLTVKTNARREVFLIFKESINNIAKHSSAKNVYIDVVITGDILILRINDDGKGFEIGPASFDDTFSSDGPSGNGITNMRKRAMEMGGRFDIDSGIGRGTTAVLTLPLEPGIDVTVEPNIHSGRP
jgi:signal transduction histidine kinase/ligand-binding sensor domain-containing protein